MKIGTVVPTATAVAAPAAQKTEAAGSPTPLPQDTASIGTGSDGAHLTKLAVGGLTSIALLVPCTYAGVAGGAVVGGMLGGALGPVTHAFSSGGVLSSLGAVWTTGGTGAQIGIALGGATAVIGSFAAGSLLGKGVGRMAGLPKDPPSNKPIDWKNWGNMAVGTTLLTAGIAAGTVGGLALAGGASAAGTLINGLVHEGFHAAALSGMGANALIGGAVGAAVAGTVCAQGASVMTKGIARHVVQGNLLKGGRELVDGLTSGKKIQTGSRLTQFVADHPLVSTANVLDVGLGVSQSLSLLSGPAGDVMKGGCFVAGAGHVIAAFANLISAGEESDRGYNKESRASVVKAAGEVLLAAGQISAGAGIGPVSLAFTGLGLVVKNAQYANC